MKSPMPRRLSLALLAAAAALVFALPGGARPAQNTLTGTVGPGFSISLVDESGNRVTDLDPGTYTITVKDQADIHNFDLTGPGVTQHTEIEFVGTATWTVTFTDGVYTYVCDAHPTQMKGQFAVGTATLPTPTPKPKPKPTAKKLAGSVGPGARIALRTASGARAASLKAGAYVRPSRPRRIKRRAVAPIPPARTKPAPSAPTATTGSFARSFPVRSAASPTSSRSSSTAAASCSRSASMSRRTSSVVRPLRPGIALQRGLGELGLADRLLGHGRCSLLDAREREHPEQAGDEEERGTDDEEREPGRDRRRETGRGRREQERDREEGKDGSAETEADPESERGDLPAHLELRELELEAGERARVLGDL